MKKNFIVLCVMFNLFFAIAAFANTVGLIQNGNGTADGLTLFAPWNATTVYLIDMDGYIAHSWDTDYEPALSVYLLEDGTLLHPGAGSSDGQAGGGFGGIIELLDWDGNQIWEYQLQGAHQPEMLALLCNLQRLVEALVGRAGPSDFARHMCQ